MSPFAASAMSPQVRPRNRGRASARDTDRCCLPRCCRTGALYAPRSAFMSRRPRRAWQLWPCQLCALDLVGVNGSRCVSVAGFEIAGARGSARELARGPHSRGRLRGDYTGEDLVAAHRIRHGRDTDRLDGRVLRQHAFDFDGGDVLAAAADHVLLAIDEAKLAAGVARDQVARVKPAARPCCRGRFGVLEVLAKETEPWVRSGAPDEQFARRADGDVAACIVDDATFDLGSARPKHAVPTCRGSRFTRSRPHRRRFPSSPTPNQRKAETLFEQCVMRGLTPAPKPKRTS